MQIKIFTIPTIGGELLEEEMNRFLRSKKILQVENQFQGSIAASPRNICSRKSANVLFLRCSAPKLSAFIHTIN